MSFSIMQTKSMTANNAALVLFFANSLPLIILVARYWNYNVALILMMALPILGFITALFSRKPKALSQEAIKIA